MWQDHFRSDIWRWLSIQEVGGGEVYVNGTLRSGGGRWMDMETSKGKAGLFLVLPNKIVHNKDKHDWVQRDIVHSISYPTFSDLQEVQCSAVVQYRTEVQFTSPVM